MALSRKPLARAKAFWLTLSLFALLAACGKRKVGDVCRAGEAACTAEHQAVFCLSGHLAMMTCLGASGCQKVGRDDVACDNPIASVGDGCNQEDDAACTIERTAALVCKASKFVVAQPCKGPRGCRTAGETVYCDNAMGEPGDLCTTEADPACKTDRSSFMKCTAGKFVITNGCRGPKKCTVTEKPDENKEHFECDDSITSAGDPCEDDGEESCSLDGKSLDVCKDHKIVPSKPCPGAHGCAYNPSTSRFDCDAKKR
jgi:hypothetical protein